MPCAKNADYLHYEQAKSYAPNPASHAGYLHAMIPSMVATRHKQMIGSRLRMMIEAINLRPVDISRTFGVSASKLGNWMRGDDYPDETFVVQFCDRFNLSADFLYRGRVSVAMEKSVADALWAAEQAFGPAFPEAADQEPEKRVKSKTSHPRQQEHKVNIAALTADIQAQK